MKHRNQISAMYIRTMIEAFPISSETFCRSSNKIRQISIKRIVLIHYRKKIGCLVSERGGAVAS